jgi:hypothetical protein
LAIGQAMAGQMAGQTGAPPAAPAPASTAAIAANAVNVEDPLAMLDRLHELVGKGVLTQAEFDTKKAQLLDKIR